MEQPSSPNHRDVKRQKLSHSPVFPTSLDQGSMQPVLPTRLDQEQKELLMRRLNDLQSSLGDRQAEESFSLFINTVGLQKADEYLDGLTKFFRDLPEVLDPCVRDYKWNCFITRSIKFEQLAKSCGFLKDQDLMDHAVRLAFLRNHPDHYFQTPKLKREIMIQALEAETQQRGDQFLNEARRKHPPSPPNTNPEHMKILSRFHELHASLKINMDDAVKSFKNFIGQFGIQLANTYLDKLQKFFEVLPSNLPHPLRDSVWNEFICRDVKFKHVIKTFSLDNKDDLQAQAIWLAFLRNYPEFYLDKQIYDLRSIISALDAESRKEGLQFLPRVICPSVSYDVIQKGQDSVFLREDIIIPPILKQLDNNTRNWDWKQYNAPYTSLIGPSMIGKSSLLKQLSHYVCVVYISLRSPLATLSYPLRSRLAPLMLPIGTSELVTHYSCLLASILKVVASFFNKQGVTEDEGVRLKQWNQYSALRGTAFETSPEGFHYDVIQEFNHHINEPLGDTLVMAANELWASTNFINKDSSLKVLLAIDEAQSLLQIPPNAGELSLFSAFCQSLAKIPSHKGIFALLTNVFTPPVATSKPVAKCDPGVTAEPKRGDKLYDPIYEIATFDLMVDPQPPKIWKDLLRTNHLFKYGHPTFATYFSNSQINQQSIKKSAQAILELARCKLLGKSNNHDLTTLTKSQAFALLGSTIQPRSTGEILLNSELIAYHGAQCEYISPTRDVIISNYPSNFTFASVANQVLSDKGKLIECIGALTANRVHGIDASGGAVELASRIILLCAMQAAMASTNQSATISYGKPVKLVEFLKALTGLDEEKLDLGTISQENRNKLLKNGMVFWNHFSHITYSPTSKDLMNFLYRGMAAQCMPNESGVDQIFPIYLRKNSADISLDEKHVSFCGVHVRNKKIHVDVVDVVQNNLQATSSEAKIREGNPHLILHMNLKSDENSISALPNLYLSTTPRGKRTVGSQDAQRASLVIEGLNMYPCLTPGVIEALKGLIDSEQDFLNLKQSTSEIEYTKIINPCLYKD